jgi:hypothetical protein
LEPSVGIAGDGPSISNSGRFNSNTIHIVPKSVLFHDC